MLYASDHPWVDPKLIADCVHEMKLAAPDEHRIYTGNAERFFSYDQKGVSTAGICGIGTGEPAAPFPVSVCNETFPDTSFGAQCRMAQRIGYIGIEIMPGTLDADPVSISAARRSELQRTIRDQGLSFVGLHNLLTVPNGLHATSSDPRIRRRTWEFVGGLIDLCAALGPNGILVFGSGKQRNAEPGVSQADALARFREGLASVAPHARSAGVTILIEPLAPQLQSVEPPGRGRGVGAADWQPRCAKYVRCPRSLPWHASRMPAGSLWRFLTSSPAEPRLLRLHSRFCEARCPIQEIKESEFNHEKGKRVLNLVVHAAFLICCGSCFGSADGG